MTRSEAATRRAIIGALAVLVAPVPAHAAGADEAGARVLFAEGRKLADDGKYPEACAKFEESLRLDPGVGTSFNLADCLDHVGRTASAWARFLDVAAATNAAGQLDRERAARARAAHLEGRLVRLAIDVSAPVPGLAVSRDGVIVGAPSWGVPVPVDPGEHVIEAVAPGMRKWSESTTVPDAPIVVRMSVPALEALPQAAPVPALPILAPSPAALPQKEARSRWSIPVIALGALGTAAITTSVVFAVEMHSANSDAKALCPSGECNDTDEKNRHDELVADAHHDRTLSLISAGIGGAALAAAAYLWWRPPRASTAERRTGRVAARPVMSAGIASLKVTW